MLLARAAGIAESRVDDDEERRRDVFQLLAQLFADLGPREPAVRAGQFLGGELILDPLAGQALGELLPPRASPSSLRLGILELGGLLGDTLGDVIGGVFTEESELGGIDALAPWAELATVKQLDLMLQLLDPPPGLPDHLRLLADDLVAESQVVGEG
jgi:hypothetical protein